MTPLTTTDLSEYRGIPAQLSDLRDLRDSAKAANTDSSLDGKVAELEDKIVFLQMRRRQLRRRGAY